MKTLKIALLLLLLPNLLLGQTFRLAPPRIAAPATFFEKNIEVALRFDMAGASIHFTLDGSEPTPRSPVYRHPIRLKKSAVLRAIAVHPDYQSSAASEARFFRVKAKKAIQSVAVFRKPSEHYPGHGWETLFDLKKGGADLHDGSWIGYSGDSMLIELVFPKKTRLRGLLVSGLSQPASWIFPPAGVEVRGAPNDWVWSSELKSDPRTAALEQFVKMELPRRKKVERLRILVKPFGLIPSGYTGEGSPAWLFLDEILIW